MTGSLIDLWEYKNTSIFEAILVWRGKYVYLLLCKYNIKQSKYDGPESILG